MGNYRKLWFTLIGVLIVTFSLLGYYGAEVYRTAPPIPAKIATAGGEVLFTHDSILDGQTAWQSVGGMQLGSIWGHGAYQAPDWTADWLHRELLNWLEVAAERAHGKPFAELDAAAQAVLRDRLKTEYRTNTYSPETGVATVSSVRADAIAMTALYYDQLFSDVPALHNTREHFAMKENTLPSAERRAQMTGFFFWTAWAAATERPGTTATYTNNWPNEPLIGNKPTAENMVWSVMSVVVMMAGVGFLDRKSTRLNSNHSQISHALFFFNDTAPTEIYPLSLHDALPISDRQQAHGREHGLVGDERGRDDGGRGLPRSEEHTSELQSQSNLARPLFF